MTKLCRLLVVVTAVPLVACGMAHAWSKPGHMRIAARAYMGLPDSTRQHVDAVLSEHPMYGAWAGNYKASWKMSKAMYVFVMASTWPDAIRRTGDPHDHPNWHFVDYRLEPPKFAFYARPSPKDDVLFGLDQSTRTVRNKATSGRERAAALSWILHLVGDAHQPLHCSTFYGSLWAKDGDEGGNDFCVKVGGKAFKLHAYWDGLFGTSQTPDTLWGDAKAFSQDATAARGNFPDLEQHKTSVKWSLESRAVAVEAAYVNGTLRGKQRVSQINSRTHEKELVPPQDSPDAPPGYTGHAQQEAKKRGILAAYRLGDLLKQLLP